MDDSSDGPQLETFVRSPARYRTTEASQLLDSFVEMVMPTEAAHARRL